MEKPSPNQLVRALSSSVRPNTRHRSSASHHRCIGDFLLFYPSLFLCSFKTNLPLLRAMGKMYKKKQDEKHGPRRENTNKQGDEMDIRKIMKDVENFSNSHMTWKERKKIEDRKVVSLGGKPLKNQRLPLSVARPMMKKQKQREEKMLQERMILGRFGGKIGGSSSSSKKQVGKHKPEDRGLKLSEGRFRNGILDVKHLLKSTPTRGNDTGKNMSNTGKRQGGNWKHDKRGGGKKHEMF